MKSLFHLKTEDESNKLGFGGDLFVHIAYFVANDFSKREDCMLAIKDIDDTIKENSIPKRIIFDWCLVIKHLYRCEPKTLKKLKAFIKDRELYDVKF